MTTSERAPKCPKKIDGVAASLAADQDPATFFGVMTGTIVVPAGATACDCEHGPQAKTAWGVTLPLFLGRTCGKLVEIDPSGQG